jgi:hypothetical protein
MVELVIVVTISIICQCVVDQIKKLFKFHKGRYFKNIINLKVLTSIIFSVLLCISYEVDIFILLGMSTSFPLIGQIITAIIVSSGSTAVHELISKINETREKDDE